MDGVALQQRTPCPGTAPQNISNRLVTGAIVEGYGFSLFAEALLRKSATMKGARGFSD